MAVIALTLQRELGELMEQIVFLLQLINSRKKQPVKFPAILMKELKETMRAAVQSITMVMIPSAYFKTITKLLRHANQNASEMVNF